MAPGKMKVRWLAGGGRKEGRGNTHTDGEERSKRLYTRKKDGEE